LILVSPVIANRGSQIKPIRCPSCKIGRLCDTISYNDAIKTIISPDGNMDTVLILKCPHCKKLIGIIVNKIEY